MSTDNQWITTRITEALAQHPLVTDAVSSHMAEVLRGQMSEQQLSQKELTSLAEMLIKAMVPTLPNPDAKK